jgi:hypothetical protein
MRAGPSLAALCNGEESGSGKANPNTAAAFITLGGKKGHLGRSLRLQRFARAETPLPCHVSTAAPRVRIRPLAPVTKSLGGSRDSRASRAGPGAVRQRLGSDVLI